MISFENSMRVSKNFSTKKLLERWGVLEKKYDKWLGGDKKSKIPRTIHQIWLGGHIPPFEKYLSDKWRVLCEDSGWEYILWDDKKVESFGLNEENFYHHSKNVGQKSDILRLEILNLIGGIYIDTDFAPVKMFDDDILSLDFFAGVTFDENPVVMNSIIGSTPKNDLILSLIEIESINDKDSMGVMNTTGPFYLTEKYFSNPIDNSCIFPVTYFFPYSNKTHDRNFGNDWEKYVKDETYCVHLWNCSWMKKF